jgi:hypothetical protein
MFTPNRNTKSTLIVVLLLIPLLFGLVVGARPAFAQVDDVTVTVTLTPTTDTNFVEEEHTVTAQLDIAASPAGGCTILAAAWSFLVTGANPNSGLVFTSLGEDSATFTYTGHNQGDDTIQVVVEGACTRVVPIIPLAFHAEATAEKHWSIFVIPESPIGIIALMASSLAALGGFMFWKRRSKPSDGMTGLGI